MWGEDGLWVDAEEGGIEERSVGDGCKYTQKKEVRQELAFEEGRVGWSAPLLDSLEA